MIPSTAVVENFACGEFVNTFLYIFLSSSRQINVTGSNLNGIHFPKLRLTFPDKTFVEKVRFS